MPSVDGVLRSLSRRALPRDGSAGKGERCHRRQQVQGGEQPRPGHVAREGWSGAGRGFEESVARYRQRGQLDTADRPGAIRGPRGKNQAAQEKLAKLGEEMQRLKALGARMLASPDQQILALAIPIPGPMATRVDAGSGAVEYNVQVAIDTEHHLIVTHEVTNVGAPTARSSRARLPRLTKATLPNGQVGGRGRPRVLQRGGDPGMQAGPASRSRSQKPPMTSGRQVRCHRFSEQ